MDTNRLLKKFLLIVIVGILLFSGCTPAGDNDLDDSESSSTVEKSTLETGGQFSTATPPAFPDLRGESFEVFLIGAVSDEFFKITESISSGLQDGFSYLNSNGGVFGAEIKYHFIGVSDYEEELQQVFLDILEADPFIVLLAVPINEEFYSLVNESRVPALFYGFGTPRLESSEFAEDFLFWLTPLPDQQMAFVLHEIWGNWEIARPPGNFNEMKVGYLTWDDQYAHTALTPESQVFIQRNNFSLDLMGEIPMVVNASAANFLLDAVSLGVTVLYTDTVTFGPTVLLNDIQSLGLSDFFVVSGSAWMMGSYVLENVRGELNIDHVYIPLSTTWWSQDEHPAIIEAHQIRLSSGRQNGEADFGYLLSLGVVDMVAEILDLVIEENQTVEVSADDVMGYLSTFQYNVMNGLFFVDYHNGNRSINQIRLWQYSSGGDMQPVGSWSDVPRLPLVEE
jgi:hypothetical protein